MNSPHDKQMEISDWLIRSALVERPLADTIISFGKKLLHIGLPVHRINCSTFQRHQIMGAVDSTWENDSG
jgi:adenylate cyclase